MTTFRLFEETVYQVRSVRDQNFRNETHLHIFFMNYYNFHTNYKHDLKYCTHTERNYNKIH